ncbi:MAG: 50S ribosomal protein L17 [Phycisphaerae bacterium]|nr:50S ribosomal protein L17 [Phycisphaerae bacterium]
MRHQMAKKHLSRTSSHRIALRRNMVASLFEHGRIETTVEKAKFIRPFAEKLITLARKGTLHARRRAIALLQDRNICVEVNGQVEKQTTVIHKLFNEIGPKFADRNGGYTRIVRLAKRRLGDNGQLCWMMLVDEPLAVKAAPAPAPVVKAPEPVVEQTTPVTEETPAETPIEEEKAE